MEDGGCASRDFTRHGNERARTRDPEHPNPSSECRPDSGVPIGDSHDPASTVVLWYCTVQQVRTMESPPEPPCNRGGYDNGAG
jgi:hypothetical protein